MRPAAAPVRLLGDKAGAHYLGVSRSQYRLLLASGTIPRVEIPGPRGQPIRRSLADVRDLDVSIERWKRKDTTNVRHERPARG